MTKFEEKAERCRGLGIAFNEVNEVRMWCSDTDENGNFIRPQDEYSAIRYDVLTEVMKMIEKML